jgi:hypothetical protein
MPSRSETRVTRGTMGMRVVVGVGSRVLVVADVDGGDVSTPGTPGDEVNDEVERFPREVGVAAALPIFLLINHARRNVEAAINNTADIPIHAGNAEDRGAGFEVWLSCDRIGEAGKRVASGAFRAVLNSSAL